MKKIDIHLHPAKDDPRLDKYLSTMDRHEVEAGLVHGVPIEGKENEAVLRAVQAHPDRFFGSVYVDLRLPIPVRDGENGSLPRICPACKGWIGTMFFTVPTASAKVMGRMKPGGKKN